ncbi:hypothetical protein T492DRAFT_961568 [Pavlovales sp. CCMP2436]|nr:hypothetical protein T492DRAFT_961568 [Pavlovales sp. CCMP2436]
MAHARSRCTAPARTSTLQRLALLALLALLPASATVHARWGLADSLCGGAHELRALAVSGLHGAGDIASNIALRLSPSPAFDGADASWLLVKPSRLAVVTGANAGHGLAISQLLAQRGVHVVMAVRSIEKGRVAAQHVHRTASGDVCVQVLQLDLTSPASVSAFCRKLGRRRVDLVVANAGIMATPHHLTADGLEEQWAANFVGHYSLCRQLWPRLADDGRVLLLSSVAHFGGYRPREPELLAADCSGPAQYDAYKAYKRSKWALACLAPELQRRLATGAQSVCAVHPGLIDTDLAFGFFRRYLPVPILRPMQRALLRSPIAAAASVLSALALPGAAGAYAVNGRVQKADRLIRNSPEAREWLWLIAASHAGLCP